MWLTDTAIKRPILTMMAVAAIVIFGIVSYPRIGVDLFPKVDFPFVSIITTLAGACPEVMDVDVTDVIEEAVGTIGGVREIFSESKMNTSAVFVEFDLGKDIDVAIQETLERISAIRGDLPRDIDEPVVMRVDPAAVAIMWLTLKGEVCKMELSTYADRMLREQLQRIRGVGAVQMGGLRLREVRIWLDNDKLRAYQITSHDVKKALQRGNIELPGGRIEGKTKEFTIRIKGEFLKVQDFNDLIIGFYEGSPVRLSNVGWVEDGMEEERSIARFNGLPAVGLGIQKQSGANTIEVIERVKKELVEIKEGLPPEMGIAISFDQSVFIERSITEIKYQLIYGGLFALLGVLFLLRSSRVAMICAISLPIAIISTFTMMNLFGFTFNNMSMLALALSIGLLIDDAIVVNENIRRHINEGMPPAQAASFAVREIGFAVMATTLVVVAVFIPIAFLEGLIGRFFLEFGLTVVFAITISLIVALTVTPMLASRLLRSEEERKRASSIYRLTTGSEWLYKKVELIYSRLLEAAINHKAAVLSIATVVFLSGILVATFVDKELMPMEDQSQFIVWLEAPPGHSVSAAYSLLSQADAAIREIPEVESTFYAQGIQGDVNEALIFVRLKPIAERQRSQMQIMAEAREKIRGNFPGIELSVDEVPMIGGGMRATPIEYVITGPDLESVRAYAEQIAAEFSKVPGVVDVDLSVVAGRPELTIFIDRDKAADLGVDIATVAETVNFLVGGEVAVTKFREAGRRYDVMVRLRPEDRDTLDDIKQIYVRSMDGRLISLSSIIYIKKVGGPGTISRVGRQRAVILFANLEGKPLDQARIELNVIADRILPHGYSGFYVGMVEIMDEAFLYLAFALILALVLSYIILAAQFESLRYPLVIFFALPLSVVGAFGALLIAGMTLNIFSFIGLILLIGLVMKNAILLVDYINTLRKRGVGRREAILRAGPVRLRPIMTTTFAIILGMLPVAIGIGEGGEVRAPMAVAVIGGLFSSLFLTLVVVPVVYDLSDNLKERFFRKSLK